ncbi:unnamed protein product [Leptidea sinapis]|uniref:Chitin-binding type-2 domain-containing protein n=1 Tax=Leptidea sinapis TaxID=189913 RepID=A0A5E4QWM6_9NEOP|nr:unnamed protein product [Leptidea sinapis]
MKVLVVSILCVVVAVTAFSVQRCPTDWEEVQLLPHMDCSKFFICAFGEAVEFPCPNGTYYDTANSTCNFRQNVDCSGRIVDAN